VAFQTAQITLVGSATAVPALVQGSSAGQFTRITGNLQDPLPVQIIQLTGTQTYWGGPGVTATTGFPLVANSPVIMALYGENEIPYLYSTGTPTIYVVVGRQ
jgi:hypothetical protein